MQERPKADDSFEATLPRAQPSNALEILMNLIYLARVQADDAAAVTRYMKMAEGYIFDLVSIVRSKDHPGASPNERSGIN